jgi:hypothetical protein
MDIEGREAQYLALMEIDHIRLLQHLGTSLDPRLQGQLKTTYLESSYCVTSPDGTIFLLRHDHAWEITPQPSGDAVKQWQLGEVSDLGIVERQVFRPEF